MPKPNCPKEVEVGTIEFSRPGQHVLEGRFDGGGMTSDASMMLLGEVDRKLGLIEAASHCIANRRSQLLIKYAVRKMSRPRVYGLALGWEDLNAHGALRQDAIRKSPRFLREDTERAALMVFEHRANQRIASRSKATPNEPSLE